MSWEITGPDWKVWLDRDGGPMRNGVGATGLDPLDAQLCSMLDRRPFAAAVAFPGNGAAPSGDMPTPSDVATEREAEAEALEITLHAGGMQVQVGDAAPPAPDVEASDDAVPEPVSDGGGAEAFFIPHLTRRRSGPEDDELQVKDGLHDDGEVTESTDVADGAGDTPPDEELEAEEVPSEELEEELEADDIVETSTPPDPPAAPDGVPVAPVNPTPVPPPRVPPPIRPKRHWSDDAFGDHFHALRRADHEDNAGRDVAFILGLLGLEPGAKVLDIGCGDGAHCFAFKRAGIEPTGLDNSLAQLLRATERNERDGAGVRFLHGDMRELPLHAQLPEEETYDAVVCLGSSFGYYEDGQNRRILEGMCERLAPDGKLVLQLCNRDHLVGRLPVRSWWQGEGCLVLDEAEMNFFANRLRVHRTVVFEDGRQFEHWVFVRAFSLHDIGKLMSRIGMRVLEVSGSRATRGSFFGATSPELWIVAERKSGAGVSTVSGRLEEP